MEIFQSYWAVLFVIAERGIAVWASVHAVLKKRDVRAVIGWVGLIWLSPLVGSLLYYAFGINRIARRGGKLQTALGAALARTYASIPQPTDEQLDEARQRYPQYLQLVGLVHQLTDRPLLPGNQVTPLVGGQTAYPAMLDAIAGAERSITLCSYIFDNDRAGRQFIDALGEAQQRGVEVRVLVDDVGSRYTRPPAVRLMRHRGIPCHTFLPTRVPKSVTYANLRNHRKIMVVDGTTSFTGGMNIREGCRLDWEPRHPVHDVHFRLEGPVAAHLQEAFAADWAFACGEVLAGDRWFPVPELVGETLARGISDGPDEDFEKLRLTMLGAISVAQRHLVVVTPYFLPDQGMISALCVAAMRGVSVRILIPAKNNIRLAQWASMATLWQVLERGCRVFLSPPPFDHTKLMLVDNGWVLVGSTNWDARSLRLNFEFNVECYGRQPSYELMALAERKIEQAHEVTLADVDGRSLPVRLRDGLARLLTPYL